MKKTLVAIAVMSVATSAAAIELYNQDGVSVDLGGNIEVYYSNSFADSEFQQELGDADFSFDTRYEVNDEFSIGGFWEFDGTNNASLGDAYVGFYTNSYGSLVAGKTATVLDGMGIGSDYQFGLTSTVDAIDFGGYQVLRYDLDTDMFYGGIGVMQNRGSENVAAGDADGMLIDGKIGVRFSGFDVVAFAGQEDIIDKDDKSTIFALEGRYSFDAVNLELGYYNVTLDKSNDVGGDTFAIAADYSIDAWSFAAGLSNVSPEDSSESSFNEGFINAGYAIAPFTTLYAEVGFNGDDAANESTAFAFGVSAEF